MQYDQQLADILILDSAIEDAPSAMFLLVDTVSLLGIQPDTKTDTISNKISINA